MFWSDTRHYRFCYRTAKSEWSGLRVSERRGRRRFHYEKCDPRLWKSEERKPNVKRWRERRRGERSIWRRSEGGRRRRARLGLHLSTQHPRKPTAEQQSGGGGGGGRGGRGRGGGGRRGGGAGGGGGGGRRGGGRGRGGGGGGLV